MEIALPGGIAASLVDSDRQVVAAVGDGGFMMNVQELETAKRLGARFTCLVFNDYDYGLISWKQHLSRDRSVSTHIDNPNFKALAESFGIRGYRPETVPALKTQLQEAVATDELTLVEVPVDARATMRSCGNWSSTGPAEREGAAGADLSCRPLAK